MNTRYGCHPADAASYDTQTLREEFLITDLFQPGTIPLTYSHTDRMVVGSAVPVKGHLDLIPEAEFRAEYFLERREMGIINIGGSGKITADGTTYKLAKGDGLYLGKGTKAVRFESDSSETPAFFYFNSVPAHKEYPAAHVTRDQATRTDLGSQEDCNRRTIYKYFHPDGAKSCQLVMGMTILAPGSVWNTMPCHTHERRMEVYLYFDLKPDALVFHYMGQPDETRHIVVREKQAVISPSWSIHSGCGTAAYTFIWGMAGENQTFSDMDAVGMETFA